MSAPIRVAAPPHSLADVSAAATAPIRVLLADDHAFMLRTMRKLLESEPRIQIVAHARDFAATLAQVAEHHPRVLVLDLDMPDGFSARAREALRSCSPYTEVVALGNDDGPEDVRRVLADGARCYVLKELADSELPQAIAAAAHGRRFVSRRVRACIEGVLRSPRDSRLTPRELEVLRLIALGHTSAEVARKLSLSPRTIETHRAHIHRKLGLATRAELVRYALSRDLLKS